jgi:putative transposase
MERPHRSSDLRERVLAAVDAGRPTAEIVDWFGVSARSVRRWVQWRRERGDVRTLARAGRTPKIAPAQHAALRAQVAAHPDATLAEHAERWEAATGTRVSVSTLSRLFRRLRLTLKKRA